MKLSASLRIAETFLNKRSSAMELQEFAKIAKRSGYSAVCMRASQLGIQTQLEEVREKKEILSTLGLAVSMVTGDFPIPENHDQKGPEALRNIDPYLDLAETLGCDLLRICMKSEDDIRWAQVAADAAKERHISIAHQCHTKSLFERVDDAIQVIKLVGRSNFGIIYEPANLELCGQDYGRRTIESLQPYIKNVYLQNQVLDVAGIDTIDTWARGGVAFNQIPMWQSGGVDFPLIIDVLNDIGYSGYVTVHQAFGGICGAEQAIVNSARYLRSIGEFE